MNAPAPTIEQKVLNGLLLTALFVTGIVLSREGPHFDNVIDGWRFFNIALVTGLLMGYFFGIRAAGVAPSLKFSGPHRLPWLAALVLGLAFTAAASSINRIFAAPPDRTFTSNIDSIDEGKVGRWYVAVKTPEGLYQRYLISKPVADELKNAKMVRIGIARGALGFDLVAKFEPVSP